MYVGFTAFRTEEDNIGFLSSVVCDTFVWKNT